jgi:hypothetical protein
VELVSDDGMGDGISHSVSSITEFRESLASGDATGFVVHSGLNPKSIRQFRQVQYGKQSIRCWSQGFALKRTIFDAKVFHRAQRRLRRLQTDQANNFPSRRYVAG